MIFEVKTTGVCEANLKSDTCYEVAYKCAKVRGSADELAESMEPEEVRVEINVISEFEIK